MHDHSLILRTSKNNIDQIRFLFPFLGIMLIAFYLCIGENSFLWFVIAFLLFLGIIYIIFELDYRRSYFKISSKECIYVNLLGNKKSFLLNDIAVLLPVRVYDSYSGFAFIDHNKNTLVKIDESLENYDKVLPFMERCQKEGIWKGSILKEYEAIEYHKTMPKKQFAMIYPTTWVKTVAKNNDKKTENAISDILIIKPNKKVLFQIKVSSVCVICSACFTIYFIIRLCYGEISAGLYMGCGLIFTIFSSMILIGSISDKYPVYKNWQLILTTSKCSFVNENGIEFSFLFENIDDIKTVVHSNGRVRYEYREIYFKNNREKIKIIFDHTMNNVEKLQDYVRYHKENGGTL